MATHHGNSGVVKVGANTLAEVSAFEYTEVAATVGDNAMGDTFDTHLVGRSSWSGSLTCWWDGSDTNGQEALTKGASVTLSLYPEGSSSSDIYMSGTATITEVGVSAEQEGIVERSFSYAGNSALTKTTVT